MPAPSHPESGTPERRIKIVNDHKAGDEAITVGTESEFGTALERIVVERRPSRIIETGTFEAKGTTLAIARGLRKSGHAARFLTIECNALNYDRALRNLARDGFLGMVTPLHGLSVPRQILPSLEQIKKWCVEDIEFDDIFVDHYEADRAQRYYAETNFDGVPDNLLGACLNLFDNQPDLVLLDSGGHMGNVEFNYLIEALEAPCVIALDDILHIKHHRSYRQIKSDPRFRLLSESREKFGSCIAEFTPAPFRPKNILWVRMDVVGDNVWAAGMLGPLRGRHPEARITVLCQKVVEEMFQTSPHVNGIITVDRGRFASDQEYHSAFCQFLALQKFDLVLNSVFSRDLVMDLMVRATGTHRTIGHDCHLNNIGAEEKRHSDLFYSKLVPQRLPHEHETERNRDFLAALGIPVEKCGPDIYLTPDDHAYATRLFEANGLDPQRTVVLTMGVGKAVDRFYRYYSRAIGPICRERGLRIALIGRPGDREVIECNRLSIADIAVDLTGQTTIRQAAAFLKRCRIVVGAETGTTTLASALGVPNVVLMGGGDFGRFLPYGPNDAVACLPLACYNCGWHCRYGIPHCVRDIAPEVLAEAFRRTLDGLGDKPRVFMQAPDRFLVAEGGPAWEKPSAWPQHCEAEFVTVSPPVVRWDSAQETAWLIRVPDEVKKVYGVYQQLADRGTRAKAQQLLLDAYRRSPQFPAPAYLYAKDVALEGRTAEAVAFLREQPAQGPETIPLSYLLIDYLAELGDFAAARDEARRLVARAPDDKLARLNLEILDGRREG